MTTYKIKTRMVIEMESEFDAETPQMAIDMARLETKQYGEQVDFTAEVTAEEPFTLRQ